MRFMTLVRGKESGPPPPQALIDGIAKLGEEAARQGVMVEMGGLLPSAVGGTIVRLTNGAITVTDGPFAEAREVIGGYAVYSVKTKAETLEWTRRFVELHRQHWKGWEGEVEVRQLMDTPPDFA